MQTNWLKAFQAITQEQEFSQIWGLYSKIDNTINFYLRTFPAKINRKMFQNNGKTLFLGHFWSFLLFLPKGSFCWKIWLSTSAVLPRHLNVKHEE